jgi:hypothetical protein
MRAGSGETELAFPSNRVETTGHRPAFRLRLEEGRREAAKMGFRAYARQNQGAGAAWGLTGLLAAV